MIVRFSGFAYLCLVLVIAIGIGIFGVRTVYAADDIKLLERKLEYLKQKKTLDAELELIKAKINKLNETYKDVSGGKTADASSPSSKADLVPRKKGPNHEWEITNVEGTCYTQAGLYFEEVKVDDDGKFSALGLNRGTWQGEYAGNLRAKKMDFSSFSFIFFRHFLVLIMGSVMLF